MNRGYFGLALYRPKTAANVGGALRNAQAFGASFVALIAPRYPERELIRSSTNVGKAERHIPVMVYPDMDAFLAARPYATPIVRIEVDGTHDLPAFHHPTSAIYLFGPEDGNAPKMPGEPSVRMDTGICLNLATTTGIVLYDRAAKSTAPDTKTHVLRHTDEPRASQGHLEIA